LASAAYLGFAIYLTWPLVTDLDTRIYGAVGDLTGAISNFRELVESGHFPFSPGTISDFNAPDGLPIRWTLNLLTLPSFGLIYVLSELFGPIAAVNLYTLLGFMLSGLAMFLLVRRIARHAGVAFVAGFAYAFYPFVVVKAQGHIDYVHGWVLVVVAWRFIELMERPTTRNGLWAGLAFVLAAAWTPYHILFAGAMGVAMGAVSLVFAWRRDLLRPTATALALAAAVGIAWLGMAGLLNTVGPRNEVRSHSINEAVVYSARAAEYVVPTSEHPLVGDWAGKYRNSHLHGSNFSENTLYVGWTILALALLGFAAAVRRQGAPRRIAVAAAAMVIVGFAFSAPPRVELLGINFPTLTEALFHFTSTWRVFSRFVVVVMLGLVLLAAIGMTSIVRRRALLLQGVILAVILVAVMGDLRAARPGSGTNKIVVPATYERLAKLPKGIAVEYPLLPAEQSPYGDVFYQGWHDKPIVNGYFPGTPAENRALRLGDLSDPATARGLEALGVRYVLIRQDLKAANLPNPGRPGRDYRFITKDPYIALYELDRKRPGTLVLPWDGFAPTEEVAGGRFQWLTQDQGTIEVRGSCTVCAGVVRLTLRSFAQPRDVTISTSDGKVLVDARHVNARRLSIPVRFNRKLVLRIEARPGPQRISAIDPRSVSVSIAEASLRLRGAHSR
jgi:hypothetical protein